jgi:TfoX/Sxy family transcriptional regulator of competence genes
MKQQQQDALALAERIRAVLPDGHASEKRMFGGVTFLVKGNMLCCAFAKGLMLRVGTDAEAAALSKPFVRRLSETRKMPGFIFIEPDGIAEKAALAHWVGKARAYVDHLPAKPAANSGKAGPSAARKKTFAKARVKKR